MHGGRGCGRVGGIEKRSTNMAFESGSMSFRMVALPRAFPKDWVEKFAEKRAGSLDASDLKATSGWVTGRHLLDTNITEESALHAGYVRLVWRTASRKVPGALLKAECRMEELARMAADGVPFLKAKDRAEIRKEVKERLTPKMPPTIKAIPFVYQPGTHHLYATAMSDTLLDTLCGALREALGFGGTPDDPEPMAQRLKNVDLMDQAGVGFSKETADVAMEMMPGREFLTWLWFKTETQNGRVALSDGRALDVLIEGPLTFAHEGNGAHLSVLKKGMPERSAEAKTCLKSGKKLKAATVTLALDEATQWRFQLDADTFGVRSLKVPQGEGPMDAVSRFQERMIYLEQFREIFCDLYGSFAELRANGRKWKGELERIREWVPSRPGRR